MDVKFREAMREDVDRLVDLVERLKRLNEEFDPLFKVREDTARITGEYLANGIDRDDRFILLAESQGRIIGMIKAEIRERLFYRPTREGKIIEFYLMPEFRHRGLGVRMIEDAASRLKERGVEIITAEFPSMNKIAGEFYTKLGYRAILSIYGKAL